MSNRKNKKCREYYSVTYPVIFITRKATRLNELGENDYRETGRKNGFLTEHIADFETRFRRALAKRYRERRQS